jgi:phospholipid/cholesterol/gamma-HCH transport system permease protein
MEAMGRLLTGIISAAGSKIKYYGGVAALICYSAKYYYSEKKGRARINQILTMQIYFTGNKALTIVGLVALSLGIVTVAQSYYILSNYGVLKQVGDILNIVIIRELGPIFTAFIILSRSATAISAEIGTMMVNDEINAMEMLGINSLKFIVFPRIAGMVIAGIFLTIYFNAISLIGGFIVGSLIADFSFDTYITYIINSITLLDIMMSIIKSAIFSLFISSIAIYHGFQAFTPTQIPQVTTNAVVSSIFALFFIDIIMTAVLIL